MPQHATRLDPRLKNFAESALAQAEVELSPATTADFQRELVKCLALVAPSGMTEGARAEWLAAAWQTLDGIPADLLKRGCMAARQWSDHPSKIVPAILREVEPIWKRRRENRSDVLAAIAKMEDSPLAPEDRCTPEQAKEIIRRVGLNLSTAEDRQPMYRGSDEMRQRIADTGTQSQEKAA